MAVAPALDQPAEVTAWSAVDRTRRRTRRPRTRATRFRAGPARRARGRPGRLGWRRRPPRPCWHVRAVTGGTPTGVQAEREAVMAQTQQFVLRVNTYGPDLLDAQGQMPDVPQRGSRR